MSSTFTFVSARVVVVPPLGVKLVAGKDMAYNTAVLEVRLPARRDGSFDTSLVEVEAWGKAAQALGALGAGDVVTANGVVHGKPYVSKAGQQRYLTVLRLREVVVERKAAVAADAEQEELGF
ncbi:MAG: hypothetical protein IKW19_00680 [Akkermansia sp.]|nr:hypothetical protein [Akkermansia sp.]MBR5184788.1 hypothetical protein [Akkermansia sp.]